MPRAIKNAMSNVSAASQEVDNAAAWGAIVLAKINTIVDAIIKSENIELEITIPLGDNIAKLFGKKHLLIDGKIPTITANVKVKLPDEPIIVKNIT